MNHFVTLATVLLGATTKTKSSGSATFLIFIVIVVAALYFLFLRPNQQKAKKQRADNASINVGDRVVSIGGIVGRIEEMHNDRVVLLTGNPDSEGDADEQPTRLVMLRSAIARKVDPASVPLPELEHDEDEGHDEDEDQDDESSDAEHNPKAEGETGA